ncbi:hypothetical protein WA026_001042 [Henosepilachna vigintioctopunctata]|uniref:GPI mannosyltransferase 2 n=1 Tax=Henosepilachna vigintioctopunctata TaxID=420089 RepID=A0AAW1V6U9_9CUCU
MKTISRKSNIVKIALCSRVILVFLQFLFNHIIPDHNANVFEYPKENGTESSVDKVVQHLFLGFLRWDAHYFMHIAKYGYTYENTLAFFPLYPVLGTLFAKIFCIQNVISTDSALLLTFIILNIVFFIFSALTLFELGCKLLPRKQAYYSALLFCWNPASVFFIAPYTECLFSWLSFKSMLNCIILYEKYCKLRLRIVIYDILYLVPIALSGLTRSNGLINIGFFLYILACIFLKNFIEIKSSMFKKFAKRLSLILAFIIITTFGVTFCIVPFDLFQIYCYRLFCFDFIRDIPPVVEMYGNNNKMVLLGTFTKHNQTWCHNKLPLAYLYVQEQYWNVGFLRYYEFKQVPNFLLAAPILGFFMYNCKKYFTKSYPKCILEIFKFDINQIKSNVIFENSLLYVFMIHGVFLSVFCMFFIHIQVSTRFLCSSSPLLYWFSADYLTEEGRLCDLKDFNKFPFKRKFIILYYFTYFIVGTAMFCNFLPWT